MLYLPLVEPLDVSPGQSHIYLWSLLLQSLMCKTPQSLTVREKGAPALPTTQLMAWAQGVARGPMTSLVYQSSSWDSSHTTLLQHIHVQAMYKGESQDMH
jgi:hypothetical protein